jgi:hypothetical protein
MHNSLKIIKTLHVSGTLVPIFRSLLILHIQPPVTVWRWVGCIFQLRSVTIVAFVCLWAWPRTQHDYHHDTKVKPEAATAVTEPLMMGGKMPETCWAVNKHQDNKLENCCIWLVIYLNFLHMFFNIPLKRNFWKQKSACKRIVNTGLIFWSTPAIPS